MKTIKKVLICGLGGLGCICASKIADSKCSDLKVLVDEQRYKKYLNQPTIFNEKKYFFDLIKPDSNEYKADLVIIATKNDGLAFAIKNIKNFIQNDTIIISLLNGITSEEEIAKIYGWENIISSFYIGHSCIREGRKITQDGVYKFVIGNRNNKKNQVIKRLTDFFDETKINYEYSDTFYDDYWKKFIINIGINQLSAAEEKTLKEIKADKKLTDMLKALMKEAQNIAEKCNIKNHALVYEKAINFLLHEIDDAYPSMLQDIKAGRKTEVDIFSGTIIKLGKKYKVPVPANTAIYEKIKEKEKLYMV